MTRAARPNSGSVSGNIQIESAASGGAAGAHAAALTKLASAIEKHAAAIDDHGAATVAAAVESNAGAAPAVAS